MDRREFLTAFAPATIANVGPGFDILGVALEQPGDLVSVRKVSQPGVRITKITGDQGRLPLEVEKNTAGVAALEFCRRLKERGGVELEIEKQMPLGSGLGSSAASSVATVKALNALYEEPFSLYTLLECAQKGELLACGTPHLDNIAPSLFGGFVFIEQENPIKLVSIPYPRDLHFVVVTPSIEIRTEEARNLLPEKVSLKTTVKHSQNVAKLLIALMKEDVTLLKGSFTDLLVQKYRSPLVPHFEEVVEAATINGALGAGLSGSGPTLFAACIGATKAQTIGLSMASVFESHGEEVSWWVSSVNPKGAYLLTRNEK